MSKTILRAMSRTVLAAALMGGIAVTGATSAQAAAGSGTCEAGELCYYYSPDQTNAVGDFTSSVRALGHLQESCEKFSGGGYESGRGNCVRNNAASVWNRTSKPVTVYSANYYGGNSQTIPAGGKANLDTSLRNHNAGHWIGSDAPNQTTVSTRGDSISRSEVISRAKYWLNHKEDNGQPLQYSQSAYHHDPEGKHTYRKDCSGFISMALHANTSYTTYSLPSISSRINWSQMSPGDYLIKNGHTVLFEKWNNSAKTSFTIIEFQGSANDMETRSFTLTYAKNNGYSPYRYNKITG